MKVQLAQIKDVERISEIFQKLNIFLDLDLDYAKIEDITQYVKEQRCYVALEENTICAAVVYKIYEGTCELEFIASNVKGGGSCLIEKVKEICRENNIPKLWCWSGTLYNALGFYTKMGFTEQLFMEKQWHGKDCYIFGCNIK